MSKWSIPALKEEHPTSAFSGCPSIFGPNRTYKLEVVEKQTYHVPLGDIYVGKIVGDFLLEGRDTARARLERISRINEISSDTVEKWRQPGIVAMRAKYGIKNFDIFDEDGNLSSSLWMTPLRLVQEDQALNEKAWTAFDKAENDLRDEDSFNKEENNDSGGKPEGETNVPNQEVHCTASLSRKQWQTKSSTVEENQRPTLGLDQGLQIDDQSKYQALLETNSKGDVILDMTGPGLNNDNSKVCVSSNQADLIHRDFTPNLVKDFKRIKNFSIREDYCPQEVIFKMDMCSGKHVMKCLGIPKFVSKDRKVFNLKFKNNYMFLEFAGIIRSVREFTWKCPLCLEIKDYILETVPKGRLKSIGPKRQA
jgi:hypothetical protein